MSGDKGSEADIRAPIEGASIEGAPIEGAPIAGAPKTGAHAQVVIQAPIEGTPFDKRMYWRSRRGMTELEQHLLPFVVTHYPTLTDPEKATYGRLLDAEDWDIFDWLQGRVDAPDPQLAELIVRIQRAMQLP